MAKISSSLHVPDDSSSRLESGYSPQVADVLVQAYRLIHRGRKTLPAYLEAAERLSTCKLKTMSRRQRMRLHFLLGLVYANAGDNALAVECIDEALECAVTLREMSAVTELLFLRGLANSGQHHFRDAITDHTQCLEIIHELMHECGAPTELLQTLELDIYLNLAMFDFALARFDRSNLWLEKTQYASGDAPADPLRVATLSWIRALLSRWSGDTGNALRYAMVADDIYSVHGTKASAGRIKTIVADIALDLAETFADDSGLQARQALLQLAHPYILESAGLVQEGGDEAGSCLALLATVRHDRLCHHSTNRIETIESVILFAQRHLDEALLSQAYTSLGSEYAARGESESSLTAYTEAVEVVRKSDVPSISFWAGRALHKIRENQVDEH